MVIDPDALQRAMRGQFPAPELGPEASDWMREIVAPIGSHPFVHRGRDVLKLVEEPLRRLKAEPPEIRLAFVFEALNEILKNSSFGLKFNLEIVVASVLRSGLALNSVEALRLVEFVSHPKVPFPFKAILSAIDGAPRTPALLTALHQLRGCVTGYRLGRDEGDPRADRRSHRWAQGTSSRTRRRVESNRLSGSLLVRKGI
jgi:hypothetical protein